MPVSCGAPCGHPFALVHGGWQWGDCRGPHFASRGYGHALQWPRPQCGDAPNYAHLSLPYFVGHGQHKCGSLKGQVRGNGYGHYCQNQPASAEPAEIRIFGRKIGGSAHACPMRAGKWLLPPPFLSDIQGGKTCRPFKVFEDFNCFAIASSAPFLHGASVG